MVDVKIMIFYLIRGTKVLVAFMFKKESCNFMQYLGIIYVLKYGDLYLNTLNFCNVYVHIVQYQHV